MAPRPISLPPAPSPRPFSSSCSESREFLHQPPPFCLPLLRVYDKNSFSDLTPQGGSGVLTPASCFRVRVGSWRGDNGISCTKLRLAGGERAARRTPRARSVSNTRSAGSSASWSSNPRRTCHHSTGRGSAPRRRPAPAYSPLFHQTGPSRAAARPDAGKSVPGSLPNTCGEIKIQAPFNSWSLGVFGRCCSLHTVACIPRRSCPSLGRKHGRGAEIT